MDKVCLFFSNLMGRFFIFNSLWPKHELVKKVFQKGKERISNDINIYEILKLIRGLKY